MKKTLKELRETTKRNESTMEKLGIPNASDFDEAEELADSFPPVVPSQEADGKKKRKTVPKKESEPKAAAAAAAVPSARTRSQTKAAEAVAAPAPSPSRKDYDDQVKSLASLTLARLKAAILDVHAFNKKKASYGGKTFASANRPSLARYIVDNKIRVPPAGTF